MIVKRGTTEGVFDAKDTTEVFQTTERVDSGTPYPPTCSSTALCASGLIHLPLDYFGFFYALETISNLFV